MTEYTLERAQEIVAEVISMRAKWGASYKMKDCSVGEHGVLDALLALAKGDSAADAKLRAELTKSNRQLGASKARETRLKQKVEKILLSVLDQDQKNSELSDQVTNLLEAKRSATDALADRTNEVDRLEAELSVALGEVTD
jgi:ATP phosphoribosyltransferase regulatory subunit HisZ